MAFGEALPQQPARPVSLIFYTGEIPHTLFGAFHLGEPCVVVTEHPLASQIRPGARLVLLTQEAEAMQRAEIEIRATVRTGSSHQLSCSPPKWEDLDRRRYRRIPRRRAVSYRRVGEEPEPGWVTTAITRDLSLEGACIEVSEALPIGTPIELRIDLSVTMPIRILGIVSREADGPYVVGVEFLDYVGGARYYLHNELNRAA